MGTFVVYWVKGMELDKKERKYKRGVTIREQIN